MRPAATVPAKLRSATGPSPSGKGKRQYRPGVIPLDLLPRECPICHRHTIIGHGRRRRQAHDASHERIWVRRGICRLCGNTIAALSTAPLGYSHRRFRYRRIIASTSPAANAAQRSWTGHRFRLGSHLETPRRADGIGHNSAGPKPHHYCAAITQFPQKLAPDSDHYNRAESGRPQVSDRAPSAPILDSV